MARRLPLLRLTGPLGHVLRGHGRERHGSARGMIRVVTLSDVRLYRDGLTRVVARCSGIDVVGSAPSSISRKRLSPARRDRERVPIRGGGICPSPPWGR